MQHHYDIAGIVRALKVIYICVCAGMGGCILGMLYVGSVRKQPGSPWINRFWHSGIAIALLGMIAILVSPYFFRT